MHKRCRSSRILVPFVFLPLLFLLLTSAIQQCATDPATETADLRISTIASISSGSTIAIAGQDIITYNLTVSNAGPNDAQNTTLSTTLPFSEYRFLKTRSLSCSLGTVVNSTSSGLSIRYIVSPSAVGSISSNASVQSITYDDDLSSNSNITTLSVTSIADLKLSMSADRSVVVSGTTVQYSIQVYNAGPSTAWSVQLTNWLPTNGTAATATSITATKGTCTTSLAQQGTITCDLDAIAVGSTVNISITAAIDSGFLPGTGSLVNVAHVQSQQNSLDPDNSTNTVMLALDSIIEPDLALSGTAGPNPVIAGGQLTYNFTITNVGPSDSKDVTLLSVLPTNTFLTNISTQELIPLMLGDTILFSLGNVMAGSTHLVSFTISISSSTNLTQVSSISSIQSSTIDVDGSNNNITLNTTVTTLADTALSIVYTNNSSTLSASDHISWTFQISNNGPSLGRNLFLFDALPSMVDFYSAAASLGSCSYSSASHSVYCSLGDLSVGHNITANITIELRPYAQNSISNTIALGSNTSDSNLANNNATCVINAVEKADTSIASVAFTPNSVVAGQVFNMTTTVYNNGPSYAWGSHVYIFMPAILSHVSSSANCSISSNSSKQAITCSLDTLPLGGNFNITSSFLAPSNVTQDLDIYLNITSTNDPDLANNTLSFMQPVDRIADLNVAISAPEAFVAGTYGTFEFKVTNYGPSDATSTVLIVRLPTNTSLNLISFNTTSRSCSPVLDSDNVINCVLGTIAQSQTAQIMVMTHLLADSPIGASHCIVASTNSSVFDPSMQDNNVTFSTKYVSDALLSANLITSPTPATPGRELNYTIAVHSAGASDSFNVALSGALAANATILSVSGDFTCMNDAMNISCTLRTIKANSTAFLYSTIWVDAAALGSITYTLNVTSESSNTSATLSTPLVAQTDVSGLFLQGPSSVIAGENMSVGMVVSNNGPSRAVNITLSHPIPTGVTLVSVIATHGSCTNTTSLVMCDLGELLPTDPAINISVSYFVAPSARNSILNTFQLASNTNDPDASNNNASISLQAVEHAEVSISSVVVDPSPVVAGQHFIVNTTVRNDGPSDAQGSNITLLVPSHNISLVSWDPGCTAMNETVQYRILCYQASIPVGGSVSIAGTFFASANMTEAIPIFSNITAVNDTHLADNSVSLDQALTRVSDLSARIATVHAVVAGTTFVYNGTVANAGPSDASSVQANITLPSLTMVNVTSFNATHGECVLFTTTVSELRCALGYLPNQQSAEIFIASYVFPSAATGVAVGANMSVASPIHDPNNTDNTKSVETLLVSDAYSDLNIFFSPTAGPYAGENITYNIIVTSLGFTNSYDIEFVNILDPSIRLLDLTPGDSVCSQTSTYNISCSISSMTAGSASSMSVVARVDASATGPLSHSVVIRSRTMNSTVTTVSSPVHTRANLYGSISTVPETAVSGEHIELRLAVLNAGPSTARAVGLAHSIPAGFTFISAVSSQGNCSNASSLVYCTLDAILPNVPEVTINITYFVNADTIGSAVNMTAIINTTTSELVTSDNQLSANIPMLQHADLIQSAVLTNASVVAGEDVAYTFSIENRGPSYSYGIFLNISLPQYVTFSRALDSTNCLDVSNNTSTNSVSCPMLGALPPGSALSITIVGKVHPATLSICNVNSTVGAETTDLIQGNNFNTTQTVQIVITKADIQIISVAPLTSPIVAGRLAQYLISVINQGPSYARSVSLSTYFPLASFVSQSITLGSCSGTGANSECNLAVLESGGTASTMLTVMVDSTANSSLSTVATISSTTMDPALENNNKTYQMPDSVTRQADISVSAWPIGYSDYIFAGRSLQYFVNITNNGPSFVSDIAYQLKLSDSLMSIAAASMSQGNCSIVIISESGGGPMAACNTGPTPVSTSAYFIFNVTIDMGHPKSNVSFRGDAYLPDPTVADLVFGNNAFIEPLGIETQANLITSIRLHRNISTNQNLTYEIVITNMNGPSTAKDLELRFELPQGVIFNHANSSSQSVSFTVVNNSTLLFSSIPDLVPGASTTINITFSIPRDIYGNIVGVAELSSSTPIANVSAATAVESAPAVALPPSAHYAIVQDGIHGPDDEVYQPYTTHLEGRWSGFADTLSGISHYWCGVGSSPFADDVASFVRCGDANANNYTYSGLSLSHATVYYFLVKCESNHGLNSSIASSNGVLVDITPPVAAQVRITSNHSSVALFSGDWDAFVDAESGVEEYFVGIGTTVETADKLPLRSVGLSTNFTHIFTSAAEYLVSGTQYYLLVKARNGATIISTIAHSVAFLIDSTPPTGRVTINNFELITEQNTAYLEWDFEDQESGIGYYELALGTSPPPITNNGNIITSIMSRSSELENARNVQNLMPFVRLPPTVTNYTATNLTMERGVSYYATVIAVNNVGLGTLTSTARSPLLMGSAKQLTSPSADRRATLNDTRTEFSVTVVVPAGATNSESGITLTILKDSDFNADPSLVPLPNDLPWYAPMFPTSPAHTFTVTVDGPAGATNDDDDNDAGGGKAQSESFVFDKPVRFILHFNTEITSIDTRADYKKLHLMYYDIPLQQWRPATDSCLELGIVPSTSGSVEMLNRDGQIYQIEVCHFTQFGLFAENRIKSLVIAGSLSGAAVVLSGCFCCVLAICVTVVVRKQQAKKRRVYEEKSFGLSPNEGSRGDKKRLKPYLEEEMMFVHPLQQNQDAHHHHHHHDDEQMPPQFRVDLERTDVNKVKNKKTAKLLSKYEVDSNNFSNKFSIELATPKYVAAPQDSPSSASASPSTKKGLWRINKRNQVSPALGKRAPMKLTAVWDDIFEAPPPDSNTDSGNVDNDDNNNNNDNDDDYEPQPVRQLAQELAHV